jgi:glycopeptide antibiotics resistance protein
MGTYLLAIRQAISIYPYVALFFSIFYIAYNYHRYGSIRSLRILIVYSFWLYLLCVYCLVILPLPPLETARDLHGHAMQLIPFKGVYEICKEAVRIHNIHLPFWRILNSSAFLVTIFNLFMTMPFGMYLHIYYEKSLKKTILLSFFLSLFFELTQLSGLYFIYSGSYRLFDVDDLIVNTLGGLLGWLAAIPLARILPTRAEIDAKSYVRGQTVSFLRRLSSFLTDLFCSLCLFAACIFLNSMTGSHVDEIHLIYVIPLYFLLVPILTNGSSPGHHLTSTRRISSNGNPAHWYQLLANTGTKLLIIVIIPILFLRFLSSDLPLRRSAFFILGGIFIGIYLLIFLLALIHMISHQPLLSERISRTKLVSTVKKPDKN